MAARKPLAINDKLDGFKVATGDERKLQWIIPHWNSSPLSVVRFFKFIVI
jgi:hypothetical protein